MASASSEQVNAAVKTVVNNYGGSSASNVSSWDGGIDLAAREYAYKNAPAGMTPAEKKEYCDRVVAGINQIRRNANTYERKQAAYDTAVAAGITPKVAKPTYEPFAGVEGQNSGSNPSPSDGGSGDSGGTDSGSGDSGSGGGGSDTTPTEDDKDGNGVPDDEEPTADPDYNVDDEYNDEDLDDNFSGPDGQWRRPAASTVGEGVKGQPSGGRDDSKNNGLKTDFETVGIHSDRHLAVAPTSNWIKSPTKSTGDRKKYSCLADALNDMAAQIETAVPGNGVSRRQRGYVTRQIPKNTEKSFLDQVVEMAYETTGAGGQHTQFAQVFSRHDRFQRSMIPKNAVFSGFTFFTRPRLCLRDYNICADRKFSILRTTDRTSVPYAIRCLLDTQFASDDQDADKCPLFDKNNPFLVPLCNSVRSVSGFNDPALVTETTEGGFFSEDQTYVIGGDRLARTYDINCMFRDFPGSPILAIIDYWCQYMANLTDGSMQQYADAIDFNRMDYTVSIYRFLMDRTNRYIARWSKCTGCFPVSPPSGVVFNLNEGEFLVNAASEINVPFKANRIEYDDPVILKEFNMLVRRYARDDIMNGGLKAFSQVAQNNFSGIPYIRPADNMFGYELLWLSRNKVGENPIFTGGANLNAMRTTIGTDIL